MTSPEMVERARRWLCAGGGGHEDGETGIRAGMITMEGAVELMAEFAQVVVSDCAKIAENPYGDEVEVIGAESPANVGRAIAAALREKYGVSQEVKK